VRSAALGPLRSVLYTPGHHVERIETAMASAADAVALVLEDSVPDDRKALARTTTASAIDQARERGRTILVKVNPLRGGGMADDLAVIARAGLAAIIVPKLRSVRDVKRVDELVGTAEVAGGLPAGAIGLVLMIETPQAVVDAHAIARASERVSGVVCAAALGGDLARELGMQLTPDGVERLYVQSKVLVDARAAGVELVLDGVWTRVKDADGLVREADRARSLGYDGKLAIHPAQLEPINRIFAPTADELDHARRVIAALDDAATRGDAATVVDGEMVDAAMAQTARELLARAGRE